MSSPPRAQNRAGKKHAPRQERAPDREQVVPWRALVTFLRVSGTVEDFFAERSQRVSRQALFDRVEPWCNDGDSKGHPYEKPHSPLPSPGTPGEGWVRVLPRQLEYPRRTLTPALSRRTRRGGMAPSVDKAQDT